MLYPNYKKSCDHVGNRIKICLFCLQKSKEMYNITKNLEEKFKNLVSKNVILDLFDERLPTVLCPACRKCVYEGSKVRGAKIKGSSETRYFKLEDSIQKLLSCRLNLRTQIDDKCKCYMCNIVKCDPEKIVNLKNRKNSYENVIKNNSKLTQEKNRSTIKRTTFKQKKTAVKRRCYDCCTPISKGTKHTCNSTSLLNNIKTDLLKDQKLKEHATLDLLQTPTLTIDNEQNIVLSQKQGRPAELIISKPSKKFKPKAIIPMEALGKIKRNLNLSFREVYGVATAIRSESKNTIKFEKNFKIKMNDDSHMLDEFFEVLDFEFVKEIKNTITETPAKGVICKNLSGLINFVKEKRDVCEVKIKFGMDGGGGFLKFCMSLVPQISENLQELKKKQYEKKYSDSGVKKLLILFIAPNVQENYNNISLIWSKLHINELENEHGTVASDLKLINLLCGLQTCSSSHPCAYCDAHSKNLEVVEIIEQ